MKSSEERLKRKPAEPVGPPPKHSKPAPSELPTEVKTEEINENEVWWEKDPELDGLWWYWKKGYGWGRWLEKSVASLQAFKTFKFCGYFCFERDTFVFLSKCIFRKTPRSLEAGKTRQQLWCICSSLEDRSSSTRTWRCYLHIIAFRNCPIRLIAKWRTKATRSTNSTSEWPMLSRQKRKID